MIVEKMNILTTDFMKMDNQKATYHNSVLATKLITNYNRSPDLEDTIDLCIHVRTPREKIVQMEEAITSYIENDSDHWHPNSDITVRDGEELDRLKISIRPKHRMKCRSDLIKAIVQVCKDLDIEEYCEPKVDTNTT